MADDRVDALLAVVRARGGRVTTCRRALVSALCRSEAHLTADDLAEQVRSTNPDIHRSTIYRSLGDLEDLGIVDHVHLGHGRAVYHLADDQHQHLVCESCGAVIEVSEDVFGPVAERVLDEYGFRMQAGHFAVLGWCSACEEGQGP